MLSIFTPPTPTRNHSHRSYLFKLFALFALLTASLSASADTKTYSLIPNKASTGLSNTSYITSLTEFTYSGISWKMNQWNPSTLQIRTNKSSATSQFRFYNTSAFPGKITKVVIHFNALTVTDASKLMFLGGTSEVTATSGGTAGTWKSTTKTLTWEPNASDNFTFFAFYQNGAAASGTNNLSSTDGIEVTYETTPTYALTINEPTGGSIAVTNDNAAVTSGDKFAAETALTVTATPTEGYSFSAWTGTTAAFASTTTNPTTFTMPAEAAEIGATFTPNNYTLTIATDNGGKMSVQVSDNEAVEKANGETLSVPFNATVTVTPVAAENYAFSAWSADGLTIDNPAANPLEFNMPAGVVTLTAAFISANIEYNINLTQTTGGTIAADKAKAKAGETVTLTATPTQTDEAYYVFTSWTVLDGDANEITVTDNQFTMPASPVEIEAKFTRQYKVTINTPEHGTLTIKNGDATVKSGAHLPAGTALTITATPEERYKDPVWQYKETSDEEFTTGNGTSFTMNAKDVTFQASFTAREYHNVTFSVNGQASEPTEVEVGESITFPANPDDIYGKKFVGWYGDEYSHATDEPTYVNTATAVMGTADVTYYAVFATVKEIAESYAETALDDFSFNVSEVMIIVGKSGSNYYALSNDNGTSASPEAVPVTVENGKITSTVSDNIKWNGSTNGSSYQFKIPGTSNYLYCTNSNTGVRVGTNDNNKFTIDKDYLYNTGTKRYLGIYNAQDWRCYTSNTGNIAGQTFTFYKYIAASREASDISTTVVQLASIAVTTEPTKKRYFVGDSFDATGMEVTATYDDGSSKAVDDYTWTPTGALTTDDDEITISYTERGTTKTTTQAITVVTPQEAGIAFAESAVSTPLNSGYTGQALTNPNSLTVTYTSSDTDVATVNAETGAVTLVGTGTTTITASFTRNDTYQSAEVSYELTVTPAVHTVTFMVNGTQQSTDIVAEGAAIYFPEVDDIAGKALAGWRTSALENVTDTEPADMVTSAIMPAADVTYYAVFAKATTTEGASNYTLDYNDDEETISELTLGYGSSVEYTAKDGGQWVIKSYKSNGMQINKTKDASIKVPNCSGNITSIAITAYSATNRAVGFSSSDYTGSETLTYLAEGTDGTSQTLDLSSANVKTGYIVPKGGNCQITKIVVNYIGTVNTYSGYCTTVTTGETSIESGNEDPVSKKYYATYSSTQKFVVPDDVTVAQVIEENGLIYLKRYAAGDVVAANTGVLLESNNTITTAFELTNKEATNLGVTNVLKASGAGITEEKMAADNPGDNYFYRLTKGTLNGDTVFGFYWKKTDGSAFDLGANKAYMVLPKSNVQSAPRYVWLGGQTTAIDGLNADTEATVGSDERIYSLDGRRVEGQLKSGIYVKNGKKFIVR